MKILDNETLLKEFETLKENVVLSELNNNFIKEDELSKIFYGVCGINEESGCAYKGSLMVHINLTIAIAKRIAKMVSGTFNVDDSSIAKAVIIQHYAKTEMFEENTNDWEIKNRGLLNKFSVIEGKLKCGARGLWMAGNSGVKTNANEAEAILSLDKTDDNGKTFENILTTIIRNANELAYAIEKEKYGN